MSNLADTYIPFDTGPGATATPDRWRRMSRGFEYNGVIPGYGSQFSASIAAGILTINPGAVWVDGFYGETTTAHTVSSVNLGAGLAVLRADPVAKTIGFFYLPGVSALPAANQSQTGSYDIPLYYVSASTAFTDVRQFTTATADWTQPTATALGYIPNLSNSNYCARGRMHRQAAYGTSTTVLDYGFDTVDFGSRFFSNYKFVCPYPDDYLITAQVGFSSNAVGQWYNIRLVHGTPNGAATPTWNGTTNASAVGAVMTAQATDIIPCRAGDTLWVQHNCSANGCSGSVGYPYAFMAVRALSR